MITLHTSKISDNLGLTKEDITVKSVSAAWTKVREIRDTTDSQLLNGTILEISADDKTPLGKRMPKRISFELNSKGKIEFRNADRFLMDVEMTGGTVTFFNPETGASKTVQCVNPSTVFSNPKVTVDLRNC